MPSFPPPSPSRPPPPPPKTVKLSSRNLLRLPYRLSHPPPSQPKASPWGITPHFRIPLEEILDRKHLPPLGLKDFEEWMLVIDRKPECLYFILWLREYKARYTAWMRKSRLSSPIRFASNPDARTYRSESLPPPPNPALVDFYARAKDTFLTPFAPYALPLPLDVLAVFFVPTDSPVANRLGTPGRPPVPPRPETFAEVEERVLAMLSDSLDRFVVATFHNVGMPRAHCGCAGGTVIGLLGSVPILVANFLTGGSRWWRFSALPGLWLGMTIVISALYGVCMMIYVFGDFRQLRSFELARVPSVHGSDKEKATLVDSPSLSARPNVQTPLTRPPALRHPAPFSVSPVTAPSPRSPPPKLRLTTPPPVHTSHHVHTSRASASHAHMLSESSSISFSTQASHRPLFSSPYSTSFQGHALEEESADEEDCEQASEVSDVSTARENRRKSQPPPQVFVSDVIYDADPSDDELDLELEDKPMRQFESRSSMTGATFIYPFSWDSVVEPPRTCDIEYQTQLATESQRMGAFNFDGLPPRPPRKLDADSPLPANPLSDPPASPSPPIILEKRPHGSQSSSGSQGSERPQSCSPARRRLQFGPIGRAIGRLQTKCVPTHISSYVMVKYPNASAPDANLSMLPEAPASAGSPASSAGSPSSPWQTSTSVQPATDHEAAAPVPQEEGAWRKRLRGVLQVPAFASPLTPVLNPVVTRGQWEIVVRSAFIAFVLSAIVIGGLVGVPEAHQVGA